MEPGRFIFLLVTLCRQFLRDECPYNNGLHKNFNKKKPRYISEIYRPCNWFTAYAVLFNVSRKPLEHELDNVNAFDYIGNLKIIKETSVRMFAIYNILQIMINQSIAHC